MSEQRASVSPVALLVQVPREAMSPHDLQMPVHSVWQQKPCSQNPDRHSSGPKHAAPGALRPQVPLVQTAGDLQSASAVHDGLHAFPPHWYGKQSVAAGVTQAPAPLQVDSAVNRLLTDGQVGSRQGVAG